MKITNGIIGALVGGLAIGFIAQTETVKCLTSDVEFPVQEGRVCISDQDYKNLKNYYKLELSKEVVDINVYFSSLLNGVVNKEHKDHGFKATGNTKQDLINLLSNN